MNIRNNVRDPEDRVIDERSEKQRKEKMMDKTVADSFPASDPPSSLPNPGNDSFNSWMRQEVAKPFRQRRERVS